MDWRGLNLLWRRAVPLALVVAVGLAVLGITATIGNHRRNASNPGKMELCRSVRDDAHSRAQAFDHENRERLAWKARARPTQLIEVGFGFMTAIPLGQAKYFIGKSRLRAITVAYYPFTDNTTFYATTTVHEGSSVDAQLKDFKQQMEHSLHDMLPSASESESRVVNNIILRIKTKELPIVRIWLSGPARELDRLSRRSDPGVYGVAYATPAEPIIPSDPATLQAIDSACRGGSA